MQTEEDWSEEGRNGGFSYKSVEARESIETKKKKNIKTTWITRRKERRRSDETTTEGITEKEVEFKKENRCL